MRLIRVFPRKTKATPTDALAYFGPPDRQAEADEVHVSVTFTYDKAWAEHLAEQWRHVGPVKICGVAYGDPGAEFVAGRYIKPGYIFTSRGCPRRCWFCSVWKRDPVPRLLPIVEGWNIHDDNLPPARASTSKLCLRCCAARTAASSSLAGSKRYRCKIIRSSYWRA